MWGCCLLAALSLNLSSCGHRSQAVTENNGELNGNISISGAFALYPLAVKWAEEFQQLHPGVHIDLSAGGAGKGMTDVLADVVDLGMVSREVYPPELEKGALPFASAKDAVVITINAENPLAKALMARGISREAATRIWITGEYKTWGQVLGTNDKTPIHVYTRSDACGAAETFALWMGKKQEDLNGTAVFGDPGLASAIQADKLDAVYRRLLGDACAANMNMLRVWGGGFYEKDIFYDLCDSLGLLVWQDFMFACSPYFVDSAFLLNVWHEGEQLVRLGKHPCIALWCGNNEVHNCMEDWHLQEIGKDLYLTHLLFFME